MHLADIDLQKYEFMPIAEGILITTEPILCEKIKSKVCSLEHYGRALNNNKKLL